MRLGVFGGSFNPPHIAHMIIAEWVRDRHELDRVLWIPASTPPHKQGEDLVESRHRLEMVRAAISGNAAFDLSEIELERGGVSYTLDTLEELESMFGDECQLHLIIGSDSYQQFATWHRPESILQRARLLVYPRGNSPVELESRFPATLVEAPLVTVSSTEIRLRARNHESIRYLVSEQVREYIESYGLYRAERGVQAKQ